MAGQGQVPFVSLLTAKLCRDEMVNIVAAVSEIGQGRRSKGTDYFLILKIVDQSSTSALSVNFFAENTSYLPHVRSNGDIISLHNVTMKIFHGEQYCVFNKSCSSFALFEGENTGDSKPYQASTMYCATYKDFRLLSQLRTWLLDHPTDAALNDRSVMLRSIKIGQVLDLVCKVLHVCKTADNNRVIFVWDGTDAPSACLQMDLDAEGESPCPLYPEVLQLSREILCSFPKLGTVLRVNAGKFYEKFSYLQEGVCWIRLCNITYELQSGMWIGALLPSSKVRLLSGEDDSVILRGWFIKNRSESNVECQPLASFPGPSTIIEVDYEHVAYSTLLASLTYPEALHTSKCIVRVVAACPWRAEDLCSLSEYPVRLTLEDPTARIHAYIYKEDAEYFFGHRLNPIVVACKMNKLLGVLDGDGSAEAQAVSRDPPWVWCCLRTYCMDEAGPWNSRRYRIFGSRLVC